MRYLEYAQPKPASPSVLEAQTIERLVLVLDISPSMLEADWPPSRLQAAQEAALALVQRKNQLAPRDEVAIVSYAAQAKVVCPPVAIGEYASKIKRSLSTMTTDSCTNITAGLKLAGDVLEENRVRSWVSWLLGCEPSQQAPRTNRILLLTDGEHNQGPSPNPLASNLKKAGVHIDCIGIGGAPSDVDEKLLKAIATHDVHTHKPRYVFIGDKADLIAKFEQLAGRISR